MPMYNRDIYLKDPSQSPLVNNGVANVSDDESSGALKVLRYELETFVCDGRYEDGVIRILDSFLKNIGQPQQSAVWVSGFFGSGKSHLVKMLRTLWHDKPFADGATPRGIATLPPEVNDRLRELSTQAKRHGGLHAASGTLGAASRDTSVRTALLGIVFKSAGLPAHYPTARFVMWLKEIGCYDAVRQAVEAGGRRWQDELDNFYVARGLHAALVQIIPTQFPSPAVCAQILINQFPNETDLSSDAMVKSLRQALQRDGKFPLTLIVLDEVQQYIGEDSRLSINVQEVVETCCNSFNGQLLIIGTGQTAVTGTSNLKRLEGRFTVRVELSDADVDSVIRKVILGKKPEAKLPIEAILQRNAGEISRHLSGTALGHREEDNRLFVADYPILPVRRRFWEYTLRVLDQTGTASQLRNQLSMVHKVIQTNLDAPLGAVAPADYLYFDSAETLLQARVLPRRIYEKTMLLRNGSPDDQLRARATGLVFLLNKLVSSNQETGIRVTVDTLADLMVEDISQGSAALRNRLPALLNGFDLLLQVGDEYRIQTEESTAWNDDFIQERGRLNNEPHRIEAERDDRIRRVFHSLVKQTSVVQGESKVSRTISVYFEAQLPADAQQRICLWVRDGWSTELNAVRADALQAGASSPTLFLFLPKRSADGLRHQLIEFKAAGATLDKRGAPDSPEGREARAAMETIKHNADSRATELLRELFSGATLLQGGGEEVAGFDLQTMVTEAARNSLARLYPKFQLADHPGWAKVYERAKNGSPDALKMVNDGGEPAGNPVCKALLAFLGNGQRGGEVRKHFESAPYGWPQDAIDGALQVLLVAGIVRARSETSQPVEATALERKNIGKTEFRQESATVSAGQRIQLRRLMQAVVGHIQPNEELAAVSDYLQRLTGLAERAGGAPPRPLRPSLQTMEGIRLLAGNEQLLALLAAGAELSAAFTVWTALADQIEARMPAWDALTRLAAHSQSLAAAAPFLEQVGFVESQRQLLDDPDPVAALSADLTHLLRTELNRLDQAYATRHAQGVARLAADPHWRRLTGEQRSQLLHEESLAESARPHVAVQSTADVLATLDRHPLDSYAGRVDALEWRFEALMTKAAKLMEPQIQLFDVPRRTLKTEQEIDDWGAELLAQLKAALPKGPIILR